MNNIFVTRENKLIVEFFKHQNLHTNSKIWNRNYFLQGTSNMETDPGKIKDIGNIKQI